MRRMRLSFRIVLFLTALIFVFSFLIVRVTDLELVHGHTYLVQAEANRFSEQRLPAARGVLLDRYNQPLVWNVEKFFQMTNPTSLYTKRTPVARDTALNILSSTQSATIVTDTQRLYRYPNSLAHVLGYVGSVSVDDLRRNDNLRVDDQVGKAGLELEFDQQLRGFPGQATFEVNAVGQKLRLVQKVEPTTGQDVPTTLDPYLSEVASQALSGQRGSVIITDAQTGKVLVMTSQPTFDPNVMSQTSVEPDKEASREAQIQNFLSDPLKVFFNRAVAGSYPPGSIFKIAVALAGLESGAINESTQVVDNGILKVGSYEYGNWFWRQYGRVEGPLSIVKAIARSNDIFFYKAAEWTGADKVAEMARAFGLGSKTGIDIPGENAGLVPDPDWKQRVKNEQWFLGDTYHMGIGQGDTLTTPIQIAQMTQAVANNGSLCQVTLDAKATPGCRQVTLSNDHLNLVLRGMIGVCSTGGTAFPLFPYNVKKLGTVNINDPATDPQKLFDAGGIGCKTGTAEFGAPDAKGNKKTHGWLTSIVGMPDSFASSAPGDALHQQWLAAVKNTGFPKRLTITVMVESDDQNPYKEGSKDAAPIAKKIVDWLTQ